MADWGLLSGLSGGLTALGEGLTERQLRKQAEEERKLARERQAQQDALEKAQLKTNEFRQMDQLNFRPASDTDILNNLALKRGQTEFKSDVSGQTFLRDQGMSPTDLRQQNEQDKRDAAMRLLQERAASQAELAKMRESGLDGRFDRVRADTEANNVARAAIEAMRQAGANARDANNPTRGGSNRDTSMDKREDRIFSQAQKLMQAEYDRFGEMVRPAMSREEAIREATSLVDGITNPGQAQPVGQQQAGAAPPQSEQGLAQRANAAIQAIQNDPARTPQEKAEDIQAVNAVLAQKIRALRGGR